MSEFDSRPLDEMLAKQATQEITFPDEPVPAPHHRPHPPRPHRTRRHGRERPVHEYNAPPAIPPTHRPVPTNAEVDAVLRQPYIPPAQNPFTGQFD